MGSITPHPALSSVPTGGEELARQHRAVRFEMVELRGMIDSCRPTQRTNGYRGMLAVLVGRLRERLALHFECEQDDHLEPVRRVHPATAPDVQRVCREHAQLLAQANRLAERLRDPLAGPDPVAQTMQWLAALRQHESAEEQLVGGPRP